MPLALLLFLICATLASVVLAAATAAAGQASTLKDNDQSYYSVTSAAKLFRDQLNGQTVTIVQTEDSSKTVTTSYDASGRTSRDNVTAVTGHTLSIDGNQVLDKQGGAGSHATVLQLDALDALLGQGTSSFTDSASLAAYADRAWSESIGGGSAIRGQDLDLGHALAVGGDLASTLQQSLQVTVEQQILPDGSIDLTFSQEGNQDGYRLTLRLAADVETSEALQETPQDPVVADAGAGYTRTETTIVTNTRTTTITWWADDISLAKEDA